MSEIKKQKTAILSTFLLRYATSKNTLNLKYKKIEKKIKF